LGFTFVIWELAPGASEGDHVHDGEDDYEETYYFLSGEGEMRIAGKSIPIKPGDAFLVQTGVDHGLRNTGGGPLRLVLLFGKPPR
jgi:mannose-6-phosphate isomerase-like protein (cupin superfamily)